MKRNFIIIGVVVVLVIAVAGIFLKGGSGSPRSLMRNTEWDMSMEEVIQIENAEYNQYSDSSITYTPTVRNYKGVDFTLLTYMFDKFDELTEIEYLFGYEGKNIDIDITKKLIKMLGEDQIVNLDFSDEGFTEISWRNDIGFIKLSILSEDTALLVLSR